MRRAAVSASTASLSSPPGCPSGCGVWFLLGVDADGGNEKLVAQAAAPTLEDAKKMPQGWESEYGLWPRLSE